jgi:hypothetical protein
MDLQFWDDIKILYYKIQSCPKTFRPKCSFIKSIPGDGDVVHLLGPRRDVERRRQPADAVAEEIFLFENWCITLTNID